MPSLARRAFRLVSAPRLHSPGPSVTETRHYNGLGQRVKRTVTQNGQSVSTHYVYDEAGQLLGEYSGDGTLVNEIVYLNDMPVLLLTPDSVHAIHADHLNTQRAIVNSAGTVLWKWDSAPYGDTPADEDPDGNGVALKFNLRFPGQLYDQETGLHYNYFRDYDPVTGRYIESDPIGLRGGMNTYGYVGQAPTNNSDKFGLDTFQCRRPLKQPVSENQRNGPDVPFNPLYHQFSCVLTNTGTMICNGQTASGNPLRSPGKESAADSENPDEFHPESCQKVRDADLCYETCVFVSWAEDRPTYSLFGPLLGGTNCQGYDNAIHKKCWLKCGTEPWMRNLQ